MNENSRIKLLRERMLRMPEICTERAYYLTESYRQTEGEPEAVRRALALRNILSKMTVRILDGELLAGLPTSKIRGGSLTPELNSRWYANELDEISVREWDRFAPISEEDKRRITEICRYWEGKSLCDKWHCMIPEEAKRYNNIIQVGGAFCGNNQNFGHISVDYEKVLKFGLSGIRDEVRKELSSVDISDVEGLNKYQYLRAVLISLDAAIMFARRYADLAADMAEKEPDTQRRAELKKLAEICAKVPVYPAESFYEAVQAVCMTYVIIMIEGPGTGIGYLRADQYLYPYYKKDIEEGRITDEEVRELIACLYIKLNSSVIPYSSEVVSAFCGFALSANITLGGLTEDGRDAVNELSRLFLEAEEMTALIAEDIVIRVSHKTPEDFLKKACILASKLRGKLKFVGDETIITQLMAEGRPLRLARGYAITGCNTPTLPGHSLDTPGGIINLPLFLELALNDGVMRMRGEQIGARTGDPRLFNSYEQLWDAFIKQAEALIPICSVFKNADKQLYAQYAQLPFQSALLNGPCRRGRDLTDGGTDYISYSMSLAGAPNVGDALAAVRKTVFEDKELTMSEVVDALDRNFEGCERVKKLLERAPKFGNNDSYVDDIVNRVLKECGAIATRKKGFAGANSGVAAASITANIGLGEIVGATPDGRKAGEPISEGGISPHQGRNVSGPTSTMMSVAHLDHSNFTNGSVLNMRFDSGLLKDDRDFTRFARLVRTFLEEGGFLVQFNFISTETLLDAQRNPDKYRDLLVRVATFTSYFVELSPPLQNDIINRLEFHTI
ncbi:MAG: glycyl radical protein [Oscillospiraceae bacterium]|jgi:pyruvate formate-lyase/glycerol dehydratase family glycyl radical enzyme